jgi:argininosuccinate lyase
VTGFAPELVDAGFAVEIADAPLLHDGLNLADLAHVLVLREDKIIPADAAKGLCALLLEAHRTPAADFPYNPAFGETYNCRERYFTSRIGSEAGWLHAGRPRREAVRTALRLRLRRDVATLVSAATDFVSAASEVAGTHADTLMADQTYLQQAQPSTFGHYLLAFAYPVVRDVVRLEGALDWINTSPAGAGCVNGSGLLRDRRRVADLLGFDDVIEHTRDAMWQTDGLLNLVAIATDLATTLSKLAEDLEIWSSQEFDYVELAAPYTRASVLMPQKRNPYALSVVRGQAGVLIGTMSGLYAVMKSPSARSDNLIFAYGEVPRAVDAAARSTRLMAGVVSDLTVNAERMRTELLAGFSQATDLAEYVMVETGVDYRSAYLVVGEAVRRASTDGLRGIDITGAMLDQAAHSQLGRGLGLADRDLSQVLDPAAIVASRVLSGGAAPSLVRGMAASCAVRAAERRAAMTTRTRGFDAAEATLVRTAEQVVADG